MLSVAEERGFHFDSVQMPLNVMDAHFRSFAHLVLPYLVDHGIAVLGMKSFGDSVLLKSDAPIQPLEYLQYSLNLPTSVVITGVESQRDLDQAFEAVRTFKPMAKPQVAELLSRSRPLCVGGQVRAVQDQHHLRRHRQERQVARRRRGGGAEARSRHGVIPTAVEADLSKAAAVSKMLSLWGSCHAPA